MIIEISLITLGLLTVFTLTKKENDKKKLIEYTNMTNEKAKEQFDKVIKGTYQSPQEKIIKPSQEYKKSFAKEYHDTVQALKTPTPIKREFKPYTTEEKKEYAIRQRKNKQIGDDYEAYIAKYYRSLGYTVIERGKTMGYADEGIDLIAENQNEINLIQCKNWKRRITHKDIKVFLHDTDKYINKNKINKKIELLYIASNDTFDAGAKWILKNERKNLNSKVIPY